MIRIYDRVRGLLSDHLTSVSLRKRSEATVAIAAILRNEGPYILEWIAHHRCLGISQFFIADHNSTDGSTALLAALARVGVIVHIPFAGPSRAPPQLAAYELIMQDHGNRVDWVAFIDGDEFLRPTTLGSDTLANWLGALPGEIGAVGVNWANYGSSHRISPGNGLIQERFTMRALDEAPVHATFKSIVRSRDWHGTTGHPHGFVIQKNRRFVDTGLQPIRPQKGRPGRATRRCWDVVRLDHFIVKSYAEFIHKKRDRGRAGQAGKRHSLEFFDSCDTNDVADPRPRAHLKAVRAEMEKIRALISDLPPEQRDLDYQLDQIPATGRDQSRA